MRVCCIGIVLWWAATSAVAGTAPVTGQLVRSDTGAPIGDGMVTCQATIDRVHVSGDGSFALDLSETQTHILVGAAKGFYNRSVLVDPPASSVTIALDPMPVEDDPAYELITPQSCALCHPNQYDEWIGSPMADAGFNTWVDDIYSGLGTPSGMGGFVYLRDSRYAGRNPASECAACHQPELWINDPGTPIADPRLPPESGVIHGISCEVCHKIADVDVTKINYPGIFAEAVTFSRPAGPDHHPVQYGVLGDTDYLHPSFMRASYQPQLVAEACGACHQDANDPQENHTFSGVISEPTYVEWKNSPYGDPESPHYASCVDCHMPASGADRVCNALNPPLLRDPSTIRSHRILGTTPEFLENAVEMSVHATREGPTVDVVVNVHNTLTGHHVPTGVTVRNMILLVEATTTSNGDLTCTSQQFVHELGGEGDPAQGYYAGLPGKFFAKVNHNAEGQGPTFFTDAAGIQFDNRIPAMASDESRYAFAVPGGDDVVSIRARLIYRRAFRFLVDAKNWTEDGHGNPLEDVLPPHFGHLMEQDTLQVDVHAGDLNGDRTVGAEDLVLWQACHAGPGAGQPTPTCAVSDLNRDGDVDLRDAASLQSNWARTIP